MEKHTTLIFALLISFQVHAQMLLINEPQMVSAQASEFDRYGKYDANLYTGRIMVRIPVYEYADADFRFSITLDYNNNGFRPNDPVSEVGLGWSLGFGGVITREVKGAPDEERGRLTAYQGSSEVAHDFEPFDSLPFSSHSSWENSPEFEVFTGYGTPGVEPKCYFSVGNHCYDGSSDIYHFSFLGHSGSFVRGLDGEYRVFNTGGANGEYKVEKVNRSIGDGSLSMYSEIVITTGDGYHYYFGSQTNKYEFNDRIFPEDAHKEGEISSSETISSWKIRKVVAPNGRTMNFSYSSHGELPRQIHNYRPAIWQKVATSSYMANYSSVRTIVTTCPLSEVAIEGSSIAIFEYEDRPTSSRQTYLTASGNQPISLENTVKLLKVVNHGRSSTHLSYAFSIIGNHYPFLIEVHTDGIGSYRMDYAGRETMDFPSFGTVATDHWGYFNKTTPSVYNRNSITMAEISSLNGLSETLTAFKNPNTIAAECGTLTYIEYPTGGYTTFQYEPNNYASVVRKSAAKNYKIDTVNESGTGGGLRVKKIENHNANGDVTDAVAYTYVSALNGNTSSGKLLSFPRYQVAYGGTCWVVPFNQWYGTTGGIFAYDRVPVEYNRVEESRNDNSRTVYYFSSWDDVPDYYSHNYIQGYREAQRGEEHVVYPAVVTNAVSVHNLLEAPGSLQSQRGKLTKRLYYAAGGVTPLKEEIMEYNAAEKELRYLPEYTNVGDAIGIGRRFTDNYDLTGTQTKEYHTTGTVTKKVSYTYNVLGQKSTETVTESDGTLRRMSYIYVSDKPITARSAVERQMISDNVVEYPLEVVEEVRKAGSQWTRVGGDRYTFSIVTGASGRCFRVTKHEKYDLSGLYYTYQEYKYDQWGNMIEKKDANGIYTSYLWDDAGNGVVVTAIGVSNEQVKNYLGTDIFNNRVGDDAVYDKAAILRTALDAAVNAVRYLKYGIPKEVMDPSGRVTAYSYDDNDRLILVKEGSKVISMTEYCTVTK